MNDIIIKLERAYKGRSLTPAKKGVKEEINGVVVNAITNYTKIP